MRGVVFALLAIAYILAYGQATTDFAHAMYMIGFTACTVFAVLFAGEDKR